MDWLVQKSPTIINLSNNNAGEVRCVHVAPRYPQIADVESIVAGQQNYATAAQLTPLLTTHSWSHRMKAIVVETTSSSTSEGHQ